MNDDDPVEPEARREAHMTWWSRLAAKVAMMSRSDDETSQMLGGAVLRQMVKIEKEIPVAAPVEGEPVAGFTRKKGSNALLTSPREPQLGELPPGDYVVYKAGTHPSEGESVALRALISDLRRVVGLSEEELRDMGGYPHGIADELMRCTVDELSRLVDTVEGEGVREALTKIGNASRIADSWKHFALGLQSHARAALASQSPAGGWREEHKTTDSSGTGTGE